MKKKIIALLCAAVLGLGTLGMVGCAKKDESFTIAFLSGGRGSTYVQELVDEFKKTDAWKNYLAANDLEDLEVNIIQGGADIVVSEVQNKINTGKYPDVMFLNYNMGGTRLTENFVSNEMLVNLDSLLEEQIPGENVTLKSKFVDGILNNYAIKPYGEAKGVYTLPAFYSPTGLWYDASRFNADGSDGKYKLPTTWDEFWLLGDELNAANGNNSASQVDGDHPSLFTYPTTGYFDSVIPAAVANSAGASKVMDMLAYKDNIWNDTDVKAGLRNVVRLRDYLSPTTVSEAGAEGGYTRNQQSVIGATSVVDGQVTQTSRGTALFVPNGDWLPAEMASTTPAGFEWGFMPLPAGSQGRYVTSFIETVYLHSRGDYNDLAKQFLLFYYSDAGAKIVAEESGAIIPTKNALAKAAENGIAASTIKLYDVYNDYPAVVGMFASTEPVTGLVWNDVLYTELNTKVFNDENSAKSIDDLLSEWVTRLESASDRYRENIIA